MSAKPIQEKEIYVSGDGMNPDALKASIGEPVTYERVIEHFRIDIPEYYNMAGDTVLRQVEAGNGEAIALIAEHADGLINRFSYAELAERSARLSNLFQELGVGRGTVVACYLGAGLEAALTYLAVFRLGGIVAPLSQLYGPDTVIHALVDSGATILVSESDLWARIAEQQNRCPDLATVVLTDPDGQQGIVDFNQYQRFSSDAHLESTRAVEPALLLYTSGSTGMPKGILHAHRILRGYLASVSLFYELEMNRPGAVLWTPSDWSWVAGIFNVMLTGWFFGQTVVASRARFSAEGSFELMARHGVTHCFLTPTALKRMAAIDDPYGRWPDLAIRSIGTGGEPLPSAVLAWGDKVLNVPINEFYGLTEVNHLIGNCRTLFPVRPGSMGKAYPGHVVAIIDQAGDPVADGEMGEIAARDDDPTLFLGYWNQLGRTASMRVGRWVRTGDLGYRDSDGYFWYHGRNDDLIKSAGYRIGPAEVEDALVEHPAIDEAAVVGSPDPDRGQVVKAFVRLAAGHAPSAELAREIQLHVKRCLAAYKYPRKIEFVSDFPLTSTGKINRKALRLKELAENSNYK
ncbi:acyl-CoA synthetase [Sedimenticola thiotaurini]|nr:AMP-binding protein [Sedimenticola thiotaurini]